MSKRIVSILLWFYASWTLGSMVVFATGVPDAIGPLLGVAITAIVVSDPRGISRRRTITAGWSAS